MSSKHPNINFSLEKKKDGCLPYLDVNIFRENEKFATNVYRKETSVTLIPTSKVFYIKHKIGLIKSLLFWCFSFCALEKLKSILCENSYPHDLVGKCNKELLQKILAPNPVVNTVPKKDLVIA